MSEESFYRWYDNTDYKAWCCDCTKDMKIAFAAGQRSYPPHVQEVLDAAVEWTHYPEACAAQEELWNAVKAYKEQTAPPTQDKPRSDKD